MAGDNGYKVTRDGGSLPDAKGGTGMKMYIDTEPGGFPQGQRSNLGQFLPQASQKSLMGRMFIGGSGRLSV